MRFWAGGAGAGADGLGVRGTWERRFGRLQVKRVFVVRFDETRAVERRANELQGGNMLLRDHLNYSWRAEGHQHQREEMALDEPMACRWGEPPRAPAAGRREHRGARCGSFRTAPSDLQGHVQVLVASRPGLSAAHPSCPTSDAGRSIPK